MSTRGNNSWKYLKIVLNFPCFRQYQSHAAYFAIAAESGADSTLGIADIDNAYIYKHHI